MTRYQGLLLAPAALLLAGASSSAELHISADFEGGSIGACRSVGENHVECKVRGETDQDGRNRQASWFYLRLDGAAGKPVTIDLVDLAGEYNYKPAPGGITDKTPPWISYDETHWEPAAGVEYRAEPPRLRVRFTPRAEPVWLARLPPYTNRNLEKLLSEVRDSPALQVETIGKSAEGRDLYLLTFETPGKGPSPKKTIWLMFRQHAWEAGTSWVAEGAIRYLAGTKARSLLRQAVIKIFPMPDPDGVARGGVRFNKYGYDLNRNWDRILPRKMPEIAAHYAAVRKWLESGRTVEMFLTVHNTEVHEYIEGPPEPQGPIVKELMMRFFHSLQYQTSFAATRPPQPAKPTTVPGRKGSMTVYQFLSREHGIPAFLMELAIARNPKVGGFRTIEDWQRFGEQLIRMLVYSVRPPRKRPLH